MKLENRDRNRGRIPSVASFSSALQLQCVAVTGFLSQNTKEMCLQVSSMWHYQASEISFSCGLDVLLRFIPGRDSWAVASSGKVDSSLSWGSSGCFLRGCGFRLCFFFFFFFLFCFVWSHWGMSYLLCVCCWGVYVCQAAIILTFGLKFCKEDTQEFSVAADMFSCYAPYCDRGIVILEVGD